MPGGGIASLDEFRSALERAGKRPKKSGGNWIAFCPAHEDKNNPSLSFGEGKRTELVASCHVGCTFEAIIAALGLDEPSRTPGRWEDRVEATYDYGDEEGELLYQAVRLRDPKGFAQRRKVNGEWEWKLGDARRVIYRLQEVRLAASEGRSVFLTEGEKDADALAKLGFVASCSPMGASKNAEAPKWRDEYSASLEGVPGVIVLADCDVPGRAHAHATCASLHAAGVPCRFVDLAPDRDDGYDAYDFLAEHGEDARADLERLAKRTPEWPRNAPRRLPIVKGAAFVESVKPHDVSKDYLGAFLHGGERVHVIGPIGHGKTTFLAEALSAALRGDTFLGFEGRGSELRGIYVDLEMPQHLLRQAIVDARLDGCPNFDLWHRPDGLEIDRNEQHRLDLESVMRDYDVVVIDPWYKLIADELAEGMGNVRTVIAALDGWRKRYPATAVMVGFHANEPQEKGQRLMLGNASGYKAYQRPADTAVTFQRVAGNRSKLIWAKTRSAFLPTMGTTWDLDWTRGEGFKRVERQKATDLLYELLTDEWQDVYELCEQTQKARSTVQELLSFLAHEGRAESRGVAGSNRKQWRRRHVEQEALAV